jgi:hypothetical protein
MSLDITKPIINQIKLENKKLQWKINIDHLKWCITNFILSDIWKLTKPDCKDKYSVYHSFVEWLSKKIK